MHVNEVIILRAEVTADLKMVNKFKSGSACGYIAAAVTQQCKKSAGAGAREKSSVVQCSGQRGRSPIKSPQPIKLLASSIKQ